MHIVLNPGQKAQVVANLAKTCGKYGVMIQSLDSNGQVYIGTDPQALNGPLDSSGNAPDGLLIQRSGAITNVPSLIPLVPFSDTLYAINVGAAATILAVFIIQLE